MAATGRPSITYSERRLMKSAEPKPDRVRNGGRPRQLYAKDDPRYQPTRTELEEDVSIPDATPHDLAQAMFGRHPRRPTVH